MRSEDERWKEWFEAAWTEREDGVYLRDFHSVGLGIYPLDVRAFNRLGQDEVDPRWLTIGVFESPPSLQRESWVYVTSGLSNAWDDESPRSAGPSGMGIEFLIQTREQAPWALNIALNLAAYQLLLAHGRFEDREPIAFWDRTGVGPSIDQKDSRLKALMFVPAPHFGEPRQLISGRFSYVQVLGITEDEHAWSRDHGAEALNLQLLAGGASPVIDTGRHSVIREGA